MEASLGSAAAKKIVVEPMTLVRNKEKPPLWPQRAGGHSNEVVPEVHAQLFDDQEMLQAL